MKVTITVTHTKTLNVTEDMYDHQNDDDSNPLDLALIEEYEQQIFEDNGLEYLDGGWTVSLSVEPAK